MRRFPAPALILLVFSLLLSSCSQARDVLPPAVDLRADARAARAQRLPIVLYFYSTTCPFCREVHDVYLVPLQRENEKQPRFLLRAVEISQPDPLVSFDGTRMDYREFAKRQGIALVPHLRFFGPEGEVLAPDLAGLMSRDFYSGYLENSLDIAAAELRKRLKQ